MVNLQCYFVSHSTPWHDPGGTAKGITVQYLGELLHESAILQPEVILLAMQFSLKHFIFTKQCIHFLQSQ